MEKKESRGTFTEPQEEVLWLFVEARRILFNDAKRGWGGSDQVASEVAAFAAAAKAGYDFNEDEVFQEYALKATVIEMLEYATIRFTNFCEKGNK